MISELKNLGLSENEAKVYLAMLNIGPSSVVEIAKKAEINRPTTYVQIESLKKKGLVSSHIKGKKQIFIAESPEHLESVVEDEMHKIAYKKDILSEVIPELLNLYNSASDRPQVRFFEGREGLLRMQEIVLKSGEKEVVGITPLDDILALFPKPDGIVGEDQ